MMQRCAMPESWWDRLFLTADNSCYFNLALLAKYMLVKARFFFFFKKGGNCFAKWQEWIECTRDGSLTNVQIKFGSSMQWCEYKTKARPKRGIIEEICAGRNAVGKWAENPDASWTFKTCPWVTPVRLLSSLRACLGLEPKRLID